MATRPRVLGPGLATEGGTAAIHHGFAELDLPRIITVTTAEECRVLACHGEMRSEASGDDPLAGGGLRLVLRREG
jgi:hypothetical protein